MSDGADEDGAVEALYEDIAAVTGMPFPNLVYRRLGEDPDRLRDCWHRVRDGLVMVGGARLRAEMLRPSPLRLRDLGRQRDLSAGQVGVLLRVLDAYDSGNACNAVVVRLLLHGRTGNTGAGPITPASDDLSPMPAELPPMLSLASMAPDAREQVLRLAAVINPTSDIVPSVFRHLGHDPGLLATLATTIEHADRQGVLREASRAVQDAVTATVHAWPQPVEPVSDPAVRAVLAPFAEAIPRTLAVSAVLRAVHGEISAGSASSNR